jgi:GNAT superfamily N-acetyltransferase
VVEWPHVADEHWANSSRDRAAVLELVRRVQASDGVAPLSEQGLLHLAHGAREPIDGVRHLLQAAEPGPGVAAYAQLDARAGGQPAAELVVDPAHRRCGHGGALLDAVLASEPAVRVWSHGLLPGAGAPTRDRFLDREISWLQFNERVLQLLADGPRPPCWSGPGSWRSSPATSTSSSWSASPGSSGGSPPASPSAPRPGWSRASCSIASSGAPSSSCGCTRGSFWDQVRPRSPRRASASCAGTELSRRRAAPLLLLVPRPRLPGAHPAGRRPGPPVPLHLGLSLNLAVVLVNPKTGTEHFARVKVPPLLPRFVRVETEPTG